MISGKLRKSGVGGGVSRASATTDVPHFLLVTACQAPLKCTADVISVAAADEIDTVIIILIL